jgi:hypothetical protein
MFGLPLAALLLLLLALMFAALELGRRLGGRDRPRHDADSRSQASGLHAGLVGLLALLLGFAFSLSASHFVLNRDFVAQEATALDTAYRRADLASEPERGALRLALRQYVDGRLAYYSGAFDAVRLRALDEQSRMLHAQLWQRAAAAAARAPTCTTALLVQAVNTVIELHETRLDAARNHIPYVVLWLLVAMSVAAASVTGYIAGLGNRTHVGPALMMLALVALVLVVIVDLDRPLRGLVHGGQESLVEVRRTMAKAERL